MACVSRIVKRDWIGAILVDHALGLIVEAVANSPFAKDTLIISIEPSEQGRRILAGA